MFSVEPNMIMVRLRDYVRAQEDYVRDKSSIDGGLHGYMVKALREDHAGFYHPDEDEDKSFDEDEFFNAAVKRSMGKN